METMRDIKRRINSIKNTQKITRAMKMVAAAKLRKAQSKAEAARPFFLKTSSIINNIAKYSRNSTDHPLLMKKEGNKKLYILITADRGLSGAYNARVIDKTKELIKKEKDISLITIGLKSKEYFSKRDYNLISEYIEIADYPEYGFAQKIADGVISLFKKEVVTEVYLIYTQFNSVISHTVKVLSLLPLSTSAEVSSEDVEYLYEPSSVEVMDYLLPQYLANVLYVSLLESKASEFGARMTAMDAATENAGELIAELTLSYNRARQAAITKEITEIVGGAEALS